MHNYYDNSKLLDSSAIGLSRPESRNFAAELASLALSERQRKSGPQPLVQGDGKPAVATPDTKTSLLATVFAMVGAMPLAELTLRPPADRAGVSVATLNHHFGNKGPESRLAAICDSHLERAVQQLAKFFEIWALLG